MSYIQKLKTKSIVKMLFPVLLISFFAAICLFVSEFWLMFQKPANLYEVPREELEGKYVTVDLGYIYTAYACTEEYEDDVATGNITSMEYIIDANVDDYCGLLLEGSDMIALGDQLLEDSYAYDSFEIDSIDSGFTVTGVMKQMPSDSLEFYYETVGYYDMSSADQEIFLPLYLDARESGDMTTTIIFLVIAVALIIWMLVLLFQAFTGKHQKQVMSKAEQLNPGNPEVILEYAQQLCENDPKSKALRMDHKLIVAQLGAKSYLFGTNELVWAYHSVTRHRVYFIPVAKSHSLILAMSDGTKLTFPMSKAKVGQWLEKIHKLNPVCVLGYNDSICKAYANDPKSLIQPQNVQQPQEQ